MKRLLAKEALFHQDRSETDERFDELDASFKEAPKRVRLFDPNGNRALVLLREIEAAPKPQ